MNSLHTAVDVLPREVRKNAVNLTDRLGEVTGGRYNEGDKDSQDEDDNECCTWTNEGSLKS